MRIHYKYFLILSIAVMFPVSLSFAADDPTEEEIQKAIEQQVIEEVELTCPVDGGKVKGYKIKSFYSAGTDRDFYQIHAGQALYDLWIACSETSGYCGYIEDFDASITPDVKAKIAEEIKPAYNLKKLGPWNKYEIAARIYIWRHKPETEIANLYLRGTYTLRNYPAGPALREKERELRKKAIKYLRKAESKGQFPIQELAQAKYLIGELYRRNEKFGKAIKYYNNALKLKNRPDWLETWTHEQLAKAYAEYAD